MPLGTAFGSCLRVFALKFGESYFIESSDDYINGHSGHRNSNGWSRDGYDFGDHGRRTRSQDADLCVNRNRSRKRLYLDEHGQGVRDGAGRTERQLYIFSSSSWRNVYFRGESCVLGPGSAD